MGKGSPELLKDVNNVICVKTITSNNNNQIYSHIHVYCIIIEYHKVFKLKVKLSIEQICSHRDINVVRFTKKVIVHVNALCIYMQQLFKFVE